MISIRSGLFGLSVMTIFTLGGFCPSMAGDEPKSPTDQQKASTETKMDDTTSTDHIMMDHSPGDTKSMNMMKNKKIPIHHAGDPPATSAGCKDHIMMDHSKGDPKSMNMMKDKTIPIHNRCKPTVKASEAVKPEDHMMMDHSKGDTKSMSKMKDKTVPIHHSGPDDKAGTESPQK